MPKELFYRISKEKQTSFLKAATKEFTHKPYEEASVNSIIKEANISRGSFYNYFEDLDTLFEFLFESIKQKRFQNAKKLIKESNGDFFVFIEKVFRSDYAQFRSEGTYSLFRNYIYYIRAKKNSSIKEEILVPIEHSLRSNQQLSSTFDLSWINVTFKEFMDVIEMAIVIVIDLFITSEQLSYSEEKTMDIFVKRINILKRGISK